MSEKDEKDGHESVHSSVSASESGKLSYFIVLKVIFESNLTFFGGNCDSHRFLILELHPISLFSKKLTENRLLGLISFVLHLKNSRIRRKS